MDYTLEEIYLLVGKEDKTASLTFKRGSNAFKNYGSYVTVVFLYSQNEREELDNKIKNKPYISSGNLKVKYLAGDISKEQIEKIHKYGINSIDIALIHYLTHPQKNTFHSKEKRQVKTLNIPIYSKPKGADFDWMYGFKKKLVNEGIGLSPKERNFYLAAKYYYEPDNLTKEEVIEIYDDSGTTIIEKVEWELIEIKYHKKELSKEETIKCISLFKKKQQEAKQILNKYLIESGSSLKKMISDNIEQAAELLIKVEHFKDIRLNVIGKIPIYLDIDSYLHIYMRHVEEMQVNKQFEHKDNFQWEEKNITFVMSEIIKEVNEEIQEYFIDNPDKRYCRYGNKSLYFEGDYYTFYIESNGRISTFFKNKKKAV